MAWPHRKLLIAILIVPSIPIALWFSVLFSYFAGDIPIGDTITLLMIVVGILFVINSLDSLTRPVFTEPGSYGGSTGSVPLHTDPCGAAHRSRCVVSVHAAQNRVDWHDRDWSLRRYLWPDVCKA